MNKKVIAFKCLSLTALIIAIVLEALPYGAALYFPVDDGKNFVLKYYSYFDLTPFGYANFAPMITAILTVLLAAVKVASMFVRRTMPKLNWVLLAINAATVIISVCSIIYGLNYYTVIGAVITVMLALSAVFHLFSIRPIENKPN